MHSDMEFRIHDLEQEAYAAVLRAFKAQSDALTWEKEGLITELRKELRVSDDEHRELLTKVNADGLIQRIREWRKSGGSLGAAASISQPVQDQLQSPTISASRKKQKTSHSVPFSTPSQTLHPQSIVGTTPPLSLAVKRGPPSATVSRRPQHPLQYPQSNQGPLFTDEHVDRTSDSLIGRKVMTRWPEDSNFYEAIITDYNAIEGRHALVYDINTPSETVEWVDLKEIPPEDIRWIGDDPGISRRNASSAGRGRGSSRDQFDNDFRPSQNGVVKKVSDDIEILHTDTLIQKVERMVETSHPDLLELEKAKKMLKEHEQALLDVIAKLAEACDDGSDGEQQYLQGQLVGRDHQPVTNVAPEMRGRSTNSYDTARNQTVQRDDEDEVVVI